jgi:hypothetical protein
MTTKIRISSYVLRLEQRLKVIDAAIDKNRRQETDAHYALIDLHKERAALAQQLHIHLERSVTK